MGGSLFPFLRSSTLPSSVPPSPARCVIVTAVHPPHSVRRSDNLPLTFYLCTCTHAQLVLKRGVENSKNAQHPIEPCNRALQ